MASDAGPQTYRGRLAETPRRLPDKAAIVEGDSTIRYAGLDAAATAIAGQVRTLAPEKPGFVCLLFQSKIAAIKAVFGARRSGSAHVMLDAGDPDARLPFIARDYVPFVVFTEAELIDKAAALAPSGCLPLLHLGLDRAPQRCRADPPERVVLRRCLWPRLRHR